jgi:predicted alpha/beta hydrolase family esterase
MSKWEGPSAFFMENTENSVALYILAGVATSENFLDDFKQELERRYEQARIDVHSSLLFPYGDWNRGLSKQIMEISNDLFPLFRRNSRYYRGQMVANYIKDTCSGGRIVIVGHSSGGVAGVHAANRLDRKLYPDVRVVQIGSPKCAVPQENRQSTLYVRAVNQKGKSADPITRLGSWGGLERKGAVTLWRSRLRAPASILTIPLIGGHADYFRTKEPFVDESGKSNLEITTDILWNWLSTH